MALASHEAPGTIIDHRYVLVSSLDAGGMGAVYRTTDQLTGTTVALKRVLTLIPGTATYNDPTRTAAMPTNAPPTAPQLMDSHQNRIALINEFKVAASLHHPNIIKLLDYGTDQARQPYFTMELLEDAQSIVEACTEQPVAVKMDLLVQMLRALNYLHRYPILHRDLKPKNVLVQRNQVKLVDFGLSVLFQHKLSQLRSQSQSADAGDMEAAGTIPYMAPELFMGSQPSVASDLYAVGMIAYEMFAGKPPFAREDVTQLLNHILFTIPDLKLPGVDPKIASIIGRLLEKDPIDRYEDAVEVIHALVSATGESIEIETEETLESSLKAARFVGREKELNQIQEQLRAALVGQGSGWLVGGKSGIGKSRLLDELRIAALTEGAMVLRGCERAEASSPYPAWSEIVRRLCLSQPLTNGQLGILKAVIPDIGELLQREVVLPPEVTSNSAQSRLFATIVELFRQIARPTVVLLEDLHHASSSSLLLLARLTRAVHDMPILVIGTYQNETSPTLPDDLPDMQKIELSPLTDNDIEHLVASMLGQPGEQKSMLKVLTEESEGNTFILIEVARSIAVAAGGTDKIPTDEKVIRKLTSTTGPSTAVQEIIRQRLTKLDASSRKLLELAAIAGLEIDRAVLQQAAPETDFERWLSYCVDVAMLSVDGDKWRFTHNKMRAGLLHEIQNDAPVLHRQIADALEKVYPDGAGHVADLAHHREAAGEHARAAVWYVKAAKQAEESYDAENAIAYYQKAVEYLPQEPLSDRIELYRGLGKMLRWQLHYDESVDAWQKMQAAAEMMNDRLSLTRACIGLSDAQERRGKRDEALANAEKAIELARDLGESARAELGEALGNRAWVLYRQRKADLAKAAAQEAFDFSNQWDLAGELTRSQSTLATIHTMTGSYTQSEYYFIQALGGARILGDRRDVAIRLNNLGELKRLMGDYEGARQHFEEALVGAREIGYRDLELVVIINLSDVNTALNDSKTARNDMARVVERATNQGWWGMSEAYRSMAEAAFGQGDYHEAYEVARKALAESTRAENAEWMGKSWRVLGMIAARLSIAIEILDDAGEVVDERAYAACFEESIRLLQEAHEELQEAYTLETWATCEYGEGNQKRGDELRQKALEAFQKMGLGIHVRRVENMAGA